MTTLFANPYNNDAQGFYFDSFEDFEEKSEDLEDKHGNPVEEFSIDFIEGDSDLDGELFRAMSVVQSDLEKYFELLNDLDEYDLVNVILALRFNIDIDDPHWQDNIDVYQVDDLEELAEQFVEEGLFGEIHASISSYIDYEKIARDLSMEYSMEEVDGRSYAVRTC